MQVTYVYHSLELCEIFWGTPFDTPSLVDLLNRNSWSFCLTSVLATAPVRPGDAHREIMSILGFNLTISSLKMHTIKLRHSWQSSARSLLRVTVNRKNVCRVWLHFKVREMIVLLPLPDTAGSASTQTIASLLHIHPHALLKSSSSDASIALLAKYFCAPLNKWRNISLFWTAGVRHPSRLNFILINEVVIDLFMGKSYETCQEHSNSFIFTIKNENAYRKGSL